jgi:hypothetical protein
MAATRPIGASQPAGPAGSRSGAARPSRRKRFAITLAGAAAGFVIIFEFLALQLQAGHDPALSGAPVTAARPGHVASATAPGGSAPVVTRSSTGVQSVPVSSTSTPQQTTTVTAKRGRGHHPIKTRTSASGGGHRGGADDLD